MKHIEITVSGRVQGVGFRNSAKHQARYLGIKGFVENIMDGTVYIEAEGDGASLAEFVKWCRKGSTFSEVEGIQVIEGTLKYFGSFESDY